MPLSQNVGFVGPSPPDAEFEHPVGRPIILALSERLRAGGWSVSEPDNWRDSGWSIDCGKPAPNLQVCLAEVSDGQWLMQVAPLRVPGVLSKLFGRREPSATPAQVQELALAAHASLTGQGFSQIRWCWDGFPDGANSGSEPAPPDAPATGQ